VNEFLRVMVAIPGVIHPHELFRLAVQMGRFGTGCSSGNSRAGEKAVEGLRRRKGEAR
jgi:hypothetical protein